MKERNKVFKISDFVVVAIIIVVFLLFWLLNRQDDLSGYVEIYKDGKLISVLKEEGRYELKSEGRHIMDVVFENRRVYVRDSDCPLKICERTGKVGPNAVIVCIPNKVVVKFVGKSDVDVMTW